MALTKVVYVDNTTVIHAQNLNDIQDEIIGNASDIDSLTESIETYTYTDQNSDGNIVITKN